MKHWILGTFLWSLEFLFQWEAFKSLLLAATREPPMSVIMMLPLHWERSGGSCLKSKEGKNIYIIFIISPWSFFQVQLIFLSEIVSGQHAYFLSFSSFLKLQSRPTDIIQRVRVIVPVWQGSCFQITGVRRQAWTSKMPPNKILSHIDPEFCSLLRGEGKTDASACKWLRPAGWGLW